MYRVFMLCSLAVFLIPNPVLAQDSVDKAADALSKAVRNTKDPEERVRILKDFLSQYPESRHTANILSGVTGIMVTDLDDLSGAIEYAKEIIGKISDKEIKVSALYILVGLYGNPGYRAEQAATVKQISAISEIRFNQYWRIINAAINADDWDAVLTYCDKAGAYANIEAFKSDYPKEEFSEDYLDEAGMHRKGMLAAVKGRVLAETGERKEALEVFYGAEKLLRRNYFGLPYEHLWYYVGLTLAETGDYDQAFERLIPYAMYQRNLPAEAVGKILEVYVNKNHSMAGFEDFMLKMRLKYAKRIHDFKLPDYSGEVRSFSKIKGDVTIVSFWSPN